MCGIGLILFKHNFISSASTTTLSKSAELLAIEKCLISCISPRGPDTCVVCKTIEGILDEETGQHENPIETETSEWILNVYACVLHMTGKLMTRQPKISDDENPRRTKCCLCWNGECYAYSKSYCPSDNSPMFDSVDETLALKNESDTEFVFSVLQDALRLVMCTQKVQRQRNQHLAIARAMGLIQGEYSFILHCCNADEKGCTQKSKGCVYFGRDPFGRRSLLMTKSLIKDNDTLETEGLVKNIQDTFILSSVALSQSMIETSNKLDDDFIYPELKEIVPGRVYCVDLDRNEISFVPILSPKLPMVPDPKQIKSVMDAPLAMLKRSEQLLFLLDQSVRRRVINAHNPQPNEASVGVLFSGGLDSVILAALCHNHIPINQPIDLINVSFSNSEQNANIDLYNSTPDREAAIFSHRELERIWPKRRWRFITVNVDYAEVKENESRICSLISPLSSTMDFNIGTAFWFASSGKGEERECSSSKIDSIGLTSRENKIAIQPQIKKKKEKCVTQDCERRGDSSCIFSSCKLCCSCYQKPISRFLGGSARICQIHISSVKFRKNQHVKNPTKKEDSLNIPSTMSMLGVKKIITSNARVLLVGIGADEQMAGYARHRSVYLREGYDALSKVLKEEKARLWIRNLGRDDRCISDHGKEARFPYLDENVVSFLDSLDIKEICDMTKPQGEGDKMILRLIAKKIGVLHCSGLVKRAIQFGSRIAKCSDVDRFGSSRKAKGTAEHINKHSDKNN